MQTADEITKGAETMTDFQFRSIIKMVLTILKTTKDTNEVIKYLEDLLENENSKK